jgi:hypothetical protein
MQLTRSRRRARDDRPCAEIDEQRPAESPWQVFAPTLR